LAVTRASAKHAVKGREVSGKIRGEAFWVDEHRVEFFE
jgi:hypothetical protein